MAIKRTTCSIVLLVLLTIFSLSLCSCNERKEIELPTAQEHVYIYDQDNCIDDKIETELNGMLVELEEKTGAEFEAAEKVAK